MHLLIMAVQFQFSKASTLGPIVTELLVAYLVVTDVGRLEILACEIIAADSVMHRTHRQMQ